MRLVMALKLISLGRGASGVRPEVMQLIEAMLEKGVIPVIPGKGLGRRVGRPGAAAHMAAAMIGEGEAFYQGARCSGAKPLDKGRPDSRSFWPPRKVSP
ncbi:MAG: aromatic amino acid lyase [Candidatus Ochrobactrum gambitense]|nr:MAG: aromatic amino acid lyase [Candidatus Ochrobactrum gambitense]